MGIIMKKLVTISKLTLLAALTASNLALAAGKRPAEDDGGQQPKHLRADADQQVLAETTITLVSSDEQSFNISLALAMLSGTIKNMLGDSADTSQDFPLPNISSAIMKNLIPCFEIIHAGKNNQTEICTALTACITQRNLSAEDLADLINAANFLDIPQILQAIFTSQPLFKRAMILSDSFPQEIQDMMSWLQTIFSSNDNQELEKNIQKVRTAKILHDPAWMRVIIDRLITSNKFGTAQDLLFLIANLGLVHGLQALLNRADINYADHLGKTALMWAPENGHIEAVELLLNTPGFDPSAHSQINQALKLAAAWGQIQVVKLLFAAGANVNFADKGWTALKYAAGNCEAEVVELLLNTPGFDPSAHNQINQALKLAAGEGDIKVVKLLLNKGADINYANQGSYTALMVAAREGHTAVLTLFLAIPVIDVNFANQAGYTAMMLGAFNGHTETVELLLNAPDFDPNAHNQLNNARMLAANKGHTNVLAILGNYLAAQNAQALPVAESQPEAQQQKPPAAQEESFWKQHCLMQ
jgi:ankyrin repeat protein